MVSVMTVCFSYVSLCEEKPLDKAMVVPRWGVAEFELKYDGAVENPFVDVQAMAVFWYPLQISRGPLEFEGFYDGDGTWRFRFVPRTEGPYAGQLTLKQGDKILSEQKVAFTCKGVQGRGFIRKSKMNPYRLEWEDGAPFYPIGIQPGSQGPMVGMDGPAQGEWRSVEFGTYLDEFEGKANLFRIQLGQGTNAGCAFQILTGKEGLYKYDLDNARLLDTAMKGMREHGFATIIIAFQDMSLWSDSKNAFGTGRDLAGWKNVKNEEALRPVKQYLRYLIARYGAYTDIWEMFNEDAYTPNEWLKEMAAFIRSYDPYKHIVTTNYERPTEDWCELVNPHEYMWMPASEVDGHLVKEIARFKSFGKPVVYTEFGNQGTLSNNDPVKYRIAVWAAFMNEAAILFWHTGGRITEGRPDAKGNANAYLGPEDRKYFKVFQDFVKDVPVTLRPVFNGFRGDPGDDLVRYALSDGKMTVLYLHHYGNHETKSQGTIYVWTGPGKFKITWIDPATGEVKGTDETTAKGNVCIFKSPEVVIDMAAKMVLMEQPK
jgi:hypothetical protein